jgi:hypothetical protein
LDVSALPVGIYLIEVNSAQGNIVKKVVKQWGSTLPFYLLLF